MKTNPLKHFAIILIGLMAFSAPIFAQVLDPGFTSPLVLRQGQTTMIKEAPGGKIYALGDFDYFGTQQVGQVVRLTISGNLDLTFNSNLPKNLDYTQIDVMPNGNVLVTGHHPVAPIPRLFLLAPDGHTIQELSDVYGPTAIEALPDNSILVGDIYGTVWRITPALSLDPTFRLLANERITDIEVYASQIYVAGDFDYVYNDADDETGTQRNRIARFNWDGTVDPSFNANAAAASFGEMRRMLIQPDGKIIPLKGHFSFYTGTIGALRLNNNGSIDPGFSFGIPSFVIEDAYYSGGTITAVSNRRIVRVNANGSVDPTFSHVVFDPGDVRITLLSDNSVIAGNLVRGTYGMARYSVSGVSLGFSAQLMRYGLVHAMDRTAASIYIGGDFIKVNDHLTRNVARLNPNGSVLKKFKTSTLYQPVTGIKAFADAKTIINSGTSLYRLVHDGTFDPSFTYVNPGIPSVSKFIVQNDGKILVGAPAKIFRLNNNGSVDLSFSAGIGVVGSGHFDFDLDRTTGKIIYAGLYPGSPDPQTGNLRRLNANGSIDPTFAPTFGAAMASTPIEKVIFLEDQSVLVTGFYVYGYNGKAYMAMKVDGTGAVDFNFLDNFADVPDDYAPWEDLHKFGDRAILSLNYFYEEKAYTESIRLDGDRDVDFSYPAGMEVDWLSDVFSDNSTELFVVGQITPTPGGGKLAIAKFIVNPLPAMAMARMGDIETSFYPNPSSDFIKVNTEQSGEVVIYNRLGQKMLSSKIGVGSETVDLTSLPRGQYSIHVKIGNKVSREQLIRE